MASAITNETLDVQKKINNHFLSIDGIKMIKTSLLNTHIADILPRLCFAIDSDNILLDYRYFKFISSSENNDYIISYVISIIKNVLKSRETFTFHVNLESLTLLQVEKNYSFITKISETLKVTFPDKLNICYIYNAPFIFHKVITIIGAFVDNKTRQKIKLVAQE